MSKMQTRSSTYPHLVEAARCDFEQLGLGYRQLSRKHGIPRSTIAYLATNRKWMKSGPRRPGQTAGDISAENAEPSANTEGLPRRKLSEDSATGLFRSLSEPKVGPLAPEARLSGIAPSKARDSVRPADQELPSHPQAPDWAGRNRATIVDFPGVVPSRSRTGAIRVLPEARRDEKGRPRGTLGEIRATLALAQIELLDQHQALLRGFMHMIAVYIEPQRFMDLTGLTDVERAEKLEETRALALRMLLPSKRDSVAGTIKTLTAALQANIDLMCKVAGLQSIKDAALIGRLGGEIDGCGIEDSQTDLIKKLSTQELRQVTHAMELLQSHQHEQREAPKPPPPEPLDDLFEPEDSATLNEPDGTEIPQR